MNTQHKSKPVLKILCALLVLLILALVGTVWAATWRCAPSSFSTRSMEELSSQVSPVLFSHEPLHLQEGHLNALLQENSKDISLPENIEILGLQLHDNVFTLWTRASVWKLSTDIAIQGTLTFDERYATLHADVQKITAGKIPLPTEKVCALLQESGLPLTGTRLSISFSKGIPIPFGGINFRLYIENICFLPYRIDVSIKDMGDQVLSFIAQFFA